MNNLKLYSEQMSFISLNNKQDLIKGIKKYKPDYKEKDLKNYTKPQLICMLAGIEYKFSKGV